MSTAPRDPFADIAIGRRAAAGNVAPPRWFYPAWGALLAGYQLALLTDSAPIMVAAGGAVGLGIMLMVRIYTDAAGVRPGPVRGVTGRWALGLGTIAGILQGASALLWLRTDVLWPSLLIAAITVPAVTVWGRRYDTARRDHLLHRGAAPALGPPRPAAEQTGDPS